ncbi:zinc-ribbon domain containing protein [Candidatus Gottesmanbacteria bacterium]|nr:zinc-ribbon domain containing protein [Candidatus Gottesmanbacteria bacterium]
MQDQTLVCKDCGKQFVWTVGEQEFYQQKGFTNPPARCPDCRKLKKQKLMENRKMFTVKCANCGNDAQVPFEPRGNRPVYCNDCFKQMKQSGGAMA